MALQTLCGFLRLGRDERRIVLLAAAALGMTRVGLRVCGFRRWQKLLGAGAPPAATELSCSESVSKARVIAKLHGSAERHLFFKPSCLERSLILQWILRRHGIPSTMRLGGRKQDERFEAHAWVEVNGVSLDKSPNDGAKFVPFDGMPSTLETEIP